MALTKLSVPGISTGGDYQVDTLTSIGTVQIGSATTVHTTGIDLGSGNITGHNLFSTGIITAVSFVGDISQATGAAAGLGSALSQDQSNPLNKVYYTDTVLSIGSTQTVNPPDSSNIAYTQYAEIAVEEGFDLIIEDGDDLVPDILGLSTETAGVLAGAGGRVRADNFTNKAGTGAPTFPNGVSVTGVATATTFSGNLGGNVAFTTTSSTTLPRGTTAERPASPVNGMIRYNTSFGTLEQYSSGSWSSIENAPLIYNVSPTSFDGSSGTTFTITGSGFKSTDTVKFVTSSGTEHTGGTVTFVGVTTLTATTPQNFSVSQEPLSVKVVTQSGVERVAAQTIDCGGSPTWSTSAGTVATINDRYGSYSTIATLSASDPDGQSITYSVSSGSLPAGTSLSSSTGVISGDPTDLSASTATSNFTVEASDGINTSSRSFSMVVNAAKDGTANFRANTSGAAIKTLNSSSADGTYWIDPYTNASYSNPQQYTVDMANDGWITVDIENIPSSNYFAIHGGPASNLTNINWNSTIANYLYVGGTSSSNNTNNWVATLFDRKLMGRAEDYLNNGWSEWDVTWRMSYQWGWGQFVLSTVSSIDTPIYGDRSTVGGNFTRSGTGDATIYMRNNNSNNANAVDFNWWNGSTSTYSTVYNVTGVADSTIHRMTLIGGTLTYYKGGAQVGSWDLTNTGTYSGTPVTANTKWLWVQNHQNPSWLAISSMKVR